MEPGPGRVFPRSKGRSALRIDSRSSTPSRAPDGIRIQLIRDLPAIREKVDRAAPALAGMKDTPRPGPGPGPTPEMVRASWMEAKEPNRSPEEKEKWTAGRSPPSASGTARPAQKACRPEERNFDA
jgi:hypothetical protein